MIGPKAAVEVPQIYPVRFYSEETEQFGEEASMSGEELFAEILPLEFYFASGTGVSQRHMLLLRI